MKVEVPLTTLTLVGNAGNRLGNGRSGRENDTITRMHRSDLGINPGGNWKVWVKSVRKPERYRASSDQQRGNSCAVSKAGRRSIMSR